MADAAKQAVGSEEFESISADQVKIEAIDWLWPGRFALGKLGLLGGMPERGKGLIISDVFARITRTGGKWPCDEGAVPHGDVILLQQEDDLSDTVVPRLRAAGADLARVHILQMIKRADGSKRMFSISGDLPMLFKKIDALTDPQILVIDPLTAYIGKLNAWSGNEVRSALMPLVDLLKHFHIAGLGIMHFNKKVDVDNALARIADSLAFGAVARHCFVTTDDPENERRLLVKAKNNLAPDVKALSYRIETRRAGQDHRDGRDVFAPCVVWGHEHVEISAIQAMQAEAGGGAASNPRKEAKDLLLRLLEGVSMAQKDVEEHAEGEGISLKTLKRAKKELGVESYKGGLAGGWMWHYQRKATAVPKISEIESGRRFSSTCAYAVCA
jgi:putative DNA primase/helicase